MNVKFRIGHRPDSSENLQAFHEHLMSTFSRVSALWDARFTNEVNLVLDGTDAAVDLTPALRDGLRGAVHYGPRYIHHVEDKAMFDDTLILELDTAQVEYRSFVESVFPVLIKEMKAYRGIAVLYKDLERDDHNAIVDLCGRTGRDENGRDGFFRLSTVNYAERELCRRAFSLTPEEIVKRVWGKVELAQVLSDGALIIYTFDLLSRDQFLRVDPELREMLK